MRERLRTRQMQLTTLRNERNRLKRRLEGAETQLKEAHQLRNELEKQLTKEQQDVIRLGKFSFLNKVKEWTGKWDEEMEKEIAEVAEAELRYNEAVKTVADMEMEVEKLRELFNNPDYQYIDDDWADFIKEKETWIRQHDSVANQTLQRITDDRVRLHSMKREIQEASEAGRAAIRALNYAIDKLGSAEGMSLWDTFLGGGIIVSALKYSEMSSSEDHIHSAQRALRNYKTELMDVQNIASESFEVNQRDLYTFTDIFFDNIFSDWMVHSRITDAKRQLTGVLQDVYQVQDQLARKLDEIDSELDRLVQEEQAIIEA